MDRESVVPSIFQFIVKREERSRSKCCCFVERQKILERKVGSAVRGERTAQQKLYEAEAEVEARN